jgi:hypothetical protein
MSETAEKKNYPKITLSIDAKLIAKLKRAAKAARRSVSAEAACRLQASLTRSPGKQ